MFLSAQIHVFGNIVGFPGSSIGKKKKKKSACNAGDPGLIPGSERSMEKGMATHSLGKYSCPKNPIDRGAWWATVYGVAKSQI